MCCAFGAVCKVSSDTRNFVARREPQNSFLLLRSAAARSACDSALRKRCPDEQRGRPVWPRPVDRQGDDDAARQRARRAGRRRPPAPAEPADG
eukprot:3653547-Prymnesium_polylepis.1